MASETTLINRAIKALDAGDPQPVLNLVAESVLPVDAPVAEQARALSTQLYFDRIGEPNPDTNHA